MPCGPLSAEARSAEDVDERFDRRVEADLLAHLADDGVGGRLAGVDVAADEPPAAVVGPPDQQDAVAVIEDGGFGPDLGGHVPEVPGEPGADLGGRERERLGVAVDRDA